LEKDREWTGKPVKPRHHQHVARFKSPDHLGKHGSITARVARFLSENLGASRSQQVGYLAARSLTTFASEKINSSGVRTVIVS
jgi:hypothetical protein